MIFLGIDFAKGTCRINTPCCNICMLFIKCHTNISISDIVSTKKIFYDMWHDHRYSQFITFFLEGYGNVGHLFIRDCEMEY